MRNGPIGIGSRRFSVGAKANGSGKPTSPWEVPLIPNPIRKVLSSMSSHRVRALLMGGQACVFYGAAEFSRDTDLLILAEAANLLRLQKALGELKAELIAVPPLTVGYLRRGHAVHFRCSHPEAQGLRVDIMSKMRGVGGFNRLWARRAALRLQDGTVCNLLSLPDLVRAKKTQRDKDWPMLRRLVEAHLFQHRAQPTARRVRFWLSELRTPELLIEFAQANPVACRKLMIKRPLLELALAGSSSELAAAIEREEADEREKDRQYWAPLKEELERIRHLRLAQAKPENAEPL